VEQLGAQGQLAEAGLGHRLDVATVGHLGLEAVEVVDEEPDGRGQPVGVALVHRDLVVDRAIVQGPVEHLAEHRLRQALVADLTEVRPRRHADLVGHRGDLRGPAVGPGAAGSDPDRHRHGGLVDLGGEGGELLVADHRARAVELEHHGHGVLGLGLGDRRGDEVDEHGVQVPRRLQHVDLAGIGAVLGQGDRREAANGQHSAENRHR